MFICAPGGNTGDEKCELHQVGAEPEVVDGHVALGGCKIDNARLCSGW